MLDLFRVSKGLDIQLEDLSSNVNILTGTGLPGGDGDVQDAAPVGSVFLRTDAEANGLQIYWKKTTTQNSFADWTTAADKAYVDAVAQGISWREPVKVIDQTAYTDLAAAVAAANIGNTVDSVTIQAGDRVLLTSLAAGNNNVYVVSGSSGAWVFTEDTNTATDGDAVLVQTGTSAEQQWVFDGTQWIQMGGATSAAELQYIRTFVGKTGPGSELPTYSSTEVVTQSSNLETAIGALDAALGTGEITNNTGNVALPQDLSWAASGTATVTTAFNNINNAIGDATFTSTSNVANGASVNTNINTLNNAVVALQQNSAKIAGTQAATVLTTMDTLPLAEATEVKWMVQVRSTGTPANRRSLEVHALTNGTAVDHTEYAILRVGGAIAGLSFNVAVSGTDLILTVNSTGGVDYVVKRIAYSAF